MPTATKEELQERAQLIRIHEANCKIDFPTADELNFRLSVMKRIGIALDLREMRKVSISGPIQTTPQRPTQVKR